MLVIFSILVSRLTLAQSLRYIETWSADRLGISAAETYELFTQGKYTQSTELTPIRSAHDEVFGFLFLPTILCCSQTITLSISLAEFIT